MPVLPPVDGTGWFDADLKNVAEVSQVVTNPLYERKYRDHVSAQVIAKPLGVAERHFPVLPAAGVLDQMQSAGTGHHLGAGLPDRCPRRQLTAVAPATPWDRREHLGTGR